MDSDFSCEGLKSTGMRPTVKHKPTEHTQLMRECEGAHRPRGRKTHGRRTLSEDDGEGNTSLRDLVGLFNQELRAAPVACVSHLWFTHMKKPSLSGSQNRKNMS